MALEVSRPIKNWWTFLIRGILYILLGIYMIASPVSTLAALGFLFGLVIFLAGVSELMRVRSDKDSGNRWWHIILGLVDIILGIVLMMHIAASADILRILVGLWFLFKGIGLFSLSAYGRSWMITLSAVLIIIFGLLILFNPVFGAITIVLWIAFAFILMGILNIALSLWLRRLQS